jgi:undecaprenyl-diphosphatase
VSILEAIILGVVQGLAEFLPVSSSGHLQIAKEALGVTLTDNMTFDIMLHVATVLATITVLWSEVAGLFRGLWTGATQWKRTPETEYVAKLLLSMIPVAVVGLLLKDELNAMLASSAILLIVGAMLLLTAALLLFAGRKSVKEGREISFKDACIIGLSQAVATIPGLSRSGTTIATGLMIGNRRAAVAQFSFLMVIVPILGEAFLDIIRGDFSDGMGVGAMPLVAGFVAAFAVGCAACKFMIEMVKRARLAWFALYCAVVGVATIIYYFAN